jgi:beta-phosphoglucomutase-like phosphatase (HAD superfamily)
MTKFNNACLLLDLDGTLANSLAVMWQTQRFLLAYQIPATQQEFAEFNDPPLASVVRQLQARYGLPADNSQLLQDYQAIIDSLYQQVAPNPTAINLLIALKQQHYQIGVISSNQ